MTLISCLSWPQNASDCISSNAIVKNFPPDPPRGSCPSGTRQKSLATFYFGLTTSKPLENTDVLLLGLCFHPYKN